MKKIEKDFIQHLYHDIDDGEKADDLVLDLMHLVGFVTMYFNGLEQHLNSILCQSLTYRSDSIGLIVLHNMGYTSKVELFKRLEDYFQISLDNSIADYDQLIKDLKECARMRNLVCHADWESSNEEGYTYVNLKISKSGLKQEYVQFNQESLNRIILSILETRHALSQYWEKREDVLRRKSRD